MCQVTSCRICKIKLTDRTSVKWGNVYLTKVGYMDICMSVAHWKQFEGVDVALFTWTGKPYQKGSKQKVFCVKRIMSVQEMEMYEENNIVKYRVHGKKGIKEWDFFNMAKNDGLDAGAFQDYFENCPFGKMAILHFTNFRY